MSKKVKAEESEVKKPKLLAKKDIKSIGYSVIKNNDTGIYELITLRFDKDTKQAFVSDIKELSKDYHRMSYELEKMLAYDKFVSE